jgi:predicted dehydrogenase
MTDGRGAARDKEKQTVSIALAGAGDHLARAHVKHLKNNPAARISGVFDPSDAPVSRLMAETGAGASLARYRTYDALLADPAVDAVMIGSPDRLHLAQLIEAVQAGKHVFCEKPMCDSEDGLGALSESLRRAWETGLVVTSCHPRRFDPPYAWLKENLAALTERHGSPVELRLDFTYHKPSKTGLHGGSMLQDHMNHEFDYLNFLFGGCGCAAHKLFDAEDRYHVAGERADGIVFAFGGTRRLDGGTYGEIIELRLERASLHIDTYNESNSYIHDHERAAERLCPITPGVTDYDLRFRAVNDNWINAILGRGANYLTMEDMLANSFMSVAFAKNSSARRSLK